MANSVVTATGDGVTVQYTLNFTLGILRRDYVTCRVGSEVDGAGDPVYRTLEWVSDIRSYSPLKTEVILSLLAGTLPPKFNT